MLAGWARLFQTSLGVRLGGADRPGQQAGSDASDRPGQQEVMLFRTKKQFFSFRNCQHIFDKNEPMELDADEPRKFQGPPDRILGQPTWVGGGPAKFWLGRRAKRRFFLERSERPWPLWGRGELSWMNI